MSANYVGVGPGLMPTPMATATEVAAGTAPDKAVSPATLKAHKSAAKAWIRWSGDGSSVLGSYGVASLTDSGVSRWTVNFSTPFASANYAVASAAIRQDFSTPTAPTELNPAYCKFESIKNDYAAVVDTAGNFAIFFGDQ